MAGLGSPRRSEAHMIFPRPITIIGGGLAGLSLGIALRRANVETQIIEAGHYPRHRVCGEFITGLDNATIELLGIGPAFAGAGSPSSVTFFLRGRAIGQRSSSCSLRSNRSERGRTAPTRRGPRRAPRARPSGVRSWRFEGA